MLQYQFSLSFYWQVGHQCLFKIHFKRFLPNIKLYFNQSLILMKHFRRGALLFAYKSPHARFHTQQMGRPPHTLRPIRYLSSVKPDNPACLELSLHAAGATHYLIKTGIQTLHKTPLLCVKVVRHGWKDTVKVTGLNGGHGVKYLHSLVKPRQKVNVTVTFSVSFISAASHSATKIPDLLS